jgi:site-specific recombinase XerD
LNAAFESGARNHALLRLDYLSGFTISEAANLRWRPVGSRGKRSDYVIWEGRKDASDRAAAPVWRELIALRGSAGGDAPVFRSAKGGHLDASQVHRIAKAAAVRAGLAPAVSAHWLRHAHASHALDRGAPIHLVQATLGHASVVTTGRYLHARPNDSSSRFLAA